MSDDVSIGELVRVVSRLESTIHQQAQLYVLHSVYRAESASRERRIEELERDLENDRQDRKNLFRLVLGSLAFPILLLILNVYLLAQGGLA
jgi:predicted RNase H-like nuclease (RuvC/YqgF family)